MAYLRLAVLVAKHEACTVAAKDLTNADKDFVALRRNGAPQVDETGERFSLDRPWAIPHPVGLRRGLRPVQRL